MLRVRYAWRERWRRINRGGLWAPSAGQMRGTGGYTLAEVIVAIAVIAIGLLGVFQMITGTMLTNTQSRNAAFATRFAEKQLETVRNTSFSSLASVPETSDTDLTAGLGNGATWERTVTTVGTAGTIKGVTITVEWEEGERETSISLSTLVHRDGINSIRTL